MVTYNQALELAKQYFNGDELAATTYLGKYALTTPEGDVLEPTPDLMHRRLAKEFARIEGNYPNGLSEEELFSYFDKFKYIIPQGSPMAGIGNPFQIMSISNCFVQGTKIHTVNRGVINIEDVEINDKVVTHKGRVKAVVQKHKNLLNNRKVYNLKCFRTPNIKVTENHKFMSISKEQLTWGQKPQFNSVEYLREGDYIQIPNNCEEGVIENFDLNQLFNLNHFQYNNNLYHVIRKENKIKLATVTTNHKTKEHKHFIPSVLTVDEEFAYFIGLWYGDGCIFGENTKNKGKRNRKDKISTTVRGITFTFGSHETRIIDFVKSYLTKKQIPIDVNENNHIDGTTQVVVHSPILGYAFEKLFGRRFDGKKLHSSMFSWPPELVNKLAQGIIDSDGAITKEGDIRVVLANKNLIQEFYHLLRSRGIFVGYSETDKTARLDFGRNSIIRNNSNKSYCDDRVLASLGENTLHSIKIDGNIFTQIISKTPFITNDQYVYTFGVEEDHSYSVEGLISLNCFVLPAPHDSFGGILHTDQQEAQIMKRRGGVGFDISTIRPKGLLTNNAAKTTDGIGVFMERFSNTCREVAQGGRRGALLLSISVHHPEIRTFINIKKDLKKVTGANISIRISDEFMNAVKNNEKVQLRFPVDEKENPSISSYVDANELWNEIVDAAHNFAEPGLLFWDNILNWCPTTNYPRFASTSTNPCFSENTLIATADGRNAVTIKQLAEEGKDVPVYSTNPKTGLIEIKMGRNPRITGYNKKLVRVTLDDGSHFDVTPDHKCMLRDGTPVLAKDLKYGDSLPRFLKEQQPVKKGSKNYWLVYGDTRNVENNRIFEHRLIAQFNQPEKWQSISEIAKQGGWAKTGGIVVHHKDYNSLNNAPENLEIMTFKEHQQFHAEHDNIGENNGNYLNVDNQTIKKHALELTKKLSRRFSNDEWQVYAATHNLPQTFSEWRRINFFVSPVELAKACAVELGLEHVDSDPRLIKTLQSMLAQNYKAFIVDNQVIVEKTCENCSQLFFTEHNSREIAFCSRSCSLIHMNSNKMIAVKRTESRNRIASEKSSKNMQNQARIFSALKFSLNRTPSLKEWEEACKKEKIPYRIGKKMKHGFKTWKEVQEAGNTYNHKVLSVTEIPGDHTVYNITVDDNHTLNIITFQDKERQNGVSVRNCGEITLSPYDSCRLLLVNALSFVENAFSKNASFNWLYFEKVVRVAQRLMDDVVDLEIECINKILNKIEMDPEPDEIKLIEKTLWLNIKSACIDGRRTGLGITAIGDMCAAMGMVYGSEDSIRFVEHVYRTLCLNSYKESINLAKERGAFPAFSFEVEKNNLFLDRIWKADKELHKEYLQYGRRNIANLTTAPAGSVSICTQTTSGIEPVFLVSYKRRKKINPNDKEARVDFVDDLGDKWQEFRVFHHGFTQWAKTNGIEHLLIKEDAVEDLIKESPYHKATANDVDWVAKVKLQAAAQKWIDHSISNTTNIPNETPIEVTKQIYMTGWESGCKGVTVYRDGSRSGVLVDEKTKNKNELLFEEHHAPKRPKELVCHVYHSTVGGEKWTIFVGLLNNKPYEVMGGLAKHIKLPKRVKMGKIVKHNGEINPARYDFHYDYEIPENETVIQDIGNIFENHTNSAFSRILSLSLRHGTPVQFIVEQLLKGSVKDSDLFSYSKVMSRVLKDYIEDGAKPSQKKCEQCKSTKLAFQQGCVTCLDCGNSRCN